MKRSRLAALAAVCAAVIGMMLVVAGVLMSGMFLPGVVVIGLAMLGFAAAGVFAVLDAEALPD
jgi:hypothetical protein